MKKWLSVIGYRLSRRLTPASAGAAIPGVTGCGLRVVIFMFLIFQFSIFNFQFPARASDWPSFGKVPTNSRYTDEVIGAPLELKWLLETGLPILSSPVAADGMVYLGGGDGYVYAISREDGSILWDYKTGDRIDATPVIYGGRVYAASRDRCLYCLDADTGMSLWIHNTGDELIASPLVVNDIVYVGTGYRGHKVLALNSMDGEVEWAYTLDQITFSSPAFGDNILYIGSNGGRYWALDAPSGLPLFLYPTDGGVNYSSPLIIPGELVLLPGRGDTYIYRVDTKAGLPIAGIEVMVEGPSLSPARKSFPGAKEAIPDFFGNPFYIDRMRGVDVPEVIRGAARAPARNGSSSPGVLSLGVLLNRVSSMAYHDRNVYFVEGGDLQYLFCLNLKENKILWYKKLGKKSGYDLVSTPAIANDQVLVGTGDGRLLVLDVEDGKILDEIILDGPVASSPAISEGMVYISTVKGTLYAFEGK